VWKHSTSTPLFSRPFVFHNASGDVMVAIGGQDGAVHCLRASLTAAVEVWRSQLGARVFSAVTAAAPLDADGTAAALVCCTTDGRVVCLQPASGAVVAELPLHGECFSSPTVALCRGHLRVLVGSRADKLHCVSVT
jgi:hypothetical protein